MDELIAALENHPDVAWWSMGRSSDQFKYHLCVKHKNEPTWRRFKSMNSHRDCLETWLNTSDNILFTTVPKPDIELSFARYCQSLNIISMEGN